jgi:hypothetical protein
MKRILLFYFPLIFFKNVSAQTNVYHPFPESGGVWNEQLEYYCFSGGYDHEYYTRIMANDTMIGLKTYHKIIVQGRISVVDTNCFSYPPNPAFAYIRQDTSMRLVYFISPGDSNENVIYDFNKVVGDSIGEGIISSIDSVLVGMDYRKRWNITGCTNGCTAFIIEGIGSSSGVIRNPCNFCQPHSPGYTLNCYSENGTLLYTDGTTQCQLIDKVAYGANEVLKPAVLPNPFHTTATIGRDNPELIFRNCELEIFNAMGMLVRKENVPNINSFVLHRGAMTNGLYFFQLNSRGDEHVYNGRFVID